jgi:DNA-binding protein HU-beta
MLPRHSVAAPGELTISDVVGGRVNKAELIKEVENRMGIDRKKAQEAVDNVVDIIVRSVAKGERVMISGFGVFEKRRREARTARNPATGAAVKVKATSVPTFRAGTGFKDVVSGGKKVAKASGAAKDAGRAKKAPGKTIPGKATPGKAVPGKAASAKRAPAAGGAATKRGTAKKSG